MQITPQILDNAANLYPQGVLEFESGICNLCKKSKEVNAFFIRATPNLHNSIIISCCNNCNPKDLYTGNEYIKLDEKDLFYLRCR